MNEKRSRRSPRKVEEAVWNLEGKRIALLGLAFKAGTDDVRGAPALALARRFADEGAVVVGHDPMAAAEARAAEPALEIADDVYDAIAGADCVVVCTEWPEYRRLDLDRLRALVATPSSSMAATCSIPPGRSPPGSRTCPSEGRRVGARLRASSHVSGRAPDAWYLLSMSEAPTRTRVGAAAYPGP